MTEQAFAKTLAFPKPRKDGSGSTAQFSFSKDKDCGFMTLAKQKSDTSIEDAKFNYDNKISVKLSDKDMACMIMVLMNKIPEINKGKGLFHQFKSADISTTSIINLKKNEPKYGGFYLSVSKTTGEKKENVGTPITEDEAIVLGIVLRSMIEKIYS